MGFLLDTDICSAYLKGEKEVWRKFMQHTGQLHVSAISAAELFTWVLRSEASVARRQAVIHLLHDMTLLDVDREVSRVFGEIRARQLDHGKVTPLLDLFIAATAIVHQLTLVTHNVRDYESVPGIAVEDWLSHP